MHPMYRPAMPTLTLGTSPITGYYTPEPETDQREIMLNQRERDREDEKQPEVPAYGRRTPLSRSVSPGGTPVVRSPALSPRAITKEESTGRIAYAVGFAFMLATVAAVMSE